MRLPLVVALLVVASGLAWTPTAAAAEPFVTDAEGDVRVSSGFLGQGAPVDHAEVGPVDLVSLTLLEDVDTVTFVLGVRSLDSSTSSSRYQIQWGFGESEFSLNVYSSFSSTLGLGPGEERRASLTRVTQDDDSYDYEYIDDLAVTVDAATATLTTVVPKVYLLTEEGKVPKRGDDFSAIRALAYGESFFGPGLFGISDAMPDTGDAGDFELTAGSFSNGHIILSSDDPFRVSNGGSTTFVMVAQVTNAAPIEDEVEILVENLPAGWDVKFAKRQRLGPEGSVPVTLLVSLPFEHAHGGISEFNLTAKSLAKPGIYASMRMGVLHTPIPQPAGHHDTLYFHSNQSASSGATVSFGSGNIVMNTERDAPDDVEEVAPSYQSCCGGESGYTWWMPLNPGLAMGLDFDLERAGELLASVVPRVPGTHHLLAEVYLTSGDDEVLVARGASAAAEAQANQPLAFTVPLEATDEADYVPYAKGQNLALSLTLVGGATTFVCCDEQISPVLRIKESSMKLPLNEYRDVVTTVEAATARLALASSDPLEKKALPGATMTFVFDVTNNGEDDIFVAEVAGSDADQGAVVPEGTIQLAKGESRRVTLAVDVPSEAAQGEQIEVILLVRSQTDPSNMAIARTFTTVTRGTDALPDETARLQAAQAEENDTPAPGVAFALAGLALVALAMRRRR